MKPAKKLPEAPVYFVIVCYNNKDLIDSCLNSIKSQSYANYRIVIVDNASSDGSAKYIKEKYPEVTLIASEKNNGFAIANNIGINEALKDSSCEFVALLNTDATVSKDWLKTITEFAQTKKHFAAGQTPTLDYYDHSVLDSRGITIDPQGRAKQLGYREVYKNRPDSVVFGVNAAACVFSVAFIKFAIELEGTFFDEDMWMYLEDVDIAARATLNGWSNYYIDGAFAYHMGSASSGKNPGFSVYMCYRNNYPMLLKSLPAKNLVSATFGVIGTDFITLAKLAKHRNFIPFKAIIRGRFNAIKMIPLFNRKRKRQLSFQKISSKDLRSLMEAR